MAGAGTQFGLVAASLSSDPRRAARRARDLGFAGLQFEAITSSLDLTHLSASGRRELRHLLASHDQQLIGLRHDIGPAGLAPGADVDRAIATLDRVVEAAAGLSAPLVCVDIGPLPSAPQAAPAKPKITPAMAGLILLPQTSSAPPESQSRQVRPPDPAFFTQIQTAMDELGRRADRYSVTLAFRSDLASFAALRQAITSVNCPWFGVDLDPVAILQDEWDLDEIFAQLGPLIRHVRARDALAGAENRTKPVTIGQGNVDWKAVLGNLHEADYRGWITIDPVDLPDRITAAQAGLKRLQS